MNEHVTPSLDHVPRLADTAIAVGNFDGVHRGHRAVIDHLCRAAAERSLSPVLVTFHPHHRVHFSPGTPPFLLTDLDEKLRLLEKAALEHVVVLPFDERLAALRAGDFLREILVGRLGARLLLVGHDQAMGRDQVRGLQAFAPLAEPLGLDVATLPPVANGSALISSTGVRSALVEGRVEEVAEALGYPYLLSGRVVHGDSRGRTLGYPTANILPADRHKLLPADGIYLVDVSGHDVHCHGLLYVGTRPTLFAGGARAVEVFLLDFEGDLYDTALSLSVRHRLRGDMKFPDEASLKSQIADDERRARELLRETAPAA